MILHLSTRWRHETAAVVAVVSLLTTACTSGGGPVPTRSASEDEPLRVVATTTVLADLVAQAGGALVRVQPLVPHGGVVETFDPSPADAAAIAEADLVVMNGLGLDEWLLDLAESAGSSDVPIVELAVDLDDVEYLEPSAEGHDDGEEPPIGEEDGHAGEAANPHLWLNVSYAQKYVEKLIETLKQVDPDDAAGYDASGTAYLQRLTELDTWVREQMATVPSENRRVVSFHEAFPYFAAAYDLEIVGTIIDAPGQDPSAGQTADLIAAIRDEGVSAIFAESQFPSELTEAISQETSIPVVTDLYNDSLGEAPVDTYEGLIRWDVERIVEALR